MSEDLEQITSSSAYEGTELCGRNQGKNGFNNSVNSISSQTCKAENHPEQDVQRRRCNWSKLSSLKIYASTCSGLWKPIMKLGQFAAKP